MSFEKLHGPGLKGDRAVEVPQLVVAASGIAERRGINWKTIEIRQPENAFEPWQGVVITALRQTCHPEVVERQSLVVAIAFGRRLQDNSVQNRIRVRLAEPQTNLAGEHAEVEVRISR